MSLVPVFKTDYTTRLTAQSEEDAEAGSTESKDNEDSEFEPITTVRRAGPPFGGPEGGFLLYISGDSVTNLDSRKEGNEQLGVRPDRSHYGIIEATRRS